MLQDVQVKPQETKAHFTDVNNMSPDDLATPGTRASAGIVLTKFLQNILHPTWVGLIPFSVIFIYKIFKA